MKKFLLIFILFPFISLSQTIFNYTDVDFTDIQFINDKEGWVVGSWGKIFKTTDGGSNWIDISIEDSTIMKIEDVEFLNSEVGFVVGGPGVIFKTDNGGMNWRRVYKYSTEERLTMEAGWFYGITFINANIGFAYGRYDVFIVTIDGGETWQKVKLNTKDLAFGEMTSKTFPHYISSESGLHCLDYFPKYDSINIKAIYKSGYDITALQFFNTKNGWAVGQGCQIIKIENGLIRNVGIPKKTNHVYLNSLYFHNMNEGWVCGNYGQLLYTKNKGKDWSIVLGFPKVPLRKVTFLNDAIGFISGNGMVYKTVDKGRTWSLVLCQRNIQEDTPIRISSFIK